MKKLINSCLLQKKQFSFSNILKSKTVIVNCNTISQQFLLYFLSNKCSQMSMWNIHCFSSILINLLTTDCCFSLNGFKSREWKHWPAIINTGMWVLLLRLQGVQWLTIFSHQGKWIKLFGSLTVIGCTCSLFSDPVLLNPLGIIGHSSYRRL